ncbi:MAG: DUF2887 domain-containing protein [Chloroflexi bacterium]|nr:DUF2887 domain-containing protein [Chloroflexota bacterium]
MQTDKLFQEYFQLVPHAIFELLQMTPACDYRYESPVVKTSERRMDGFLEPMQAGCPYYFVEVQGYYDRRIYWRSLHHVTRYHETRADLDGQNWQMIVFFLDRAYDPGPDTLGPLAVGSERWLVSGSLPELLTKTSDLSPLLNVLRPLAAADVAEVQTQGPGWVESIKSLIDLDAQQRSNLLDLLVKFLIQRFANLPYKEIEAMLKLTPLEETRAGQELIQLGREEGREVGREEGREVGREEGLREGISVVLEGRFEDIAADLLIRIATQMKQIHDHETLEVLLKLAARIASPSAFEQRITDMLTRAANPAELS